MSDSDRERMDVGDELWQMASAADVAAAILGGLLMRAGSGAPRRSWRSRGGRYGGGRSANAFRRFPGRSPTTRRAAGLPVREVRGTSRRCGWRWSGPTDGTAGAVQRTSRDWHVTGSRPEAGPGTGGRAVVGRGDQRGGPSLRSRGMLMAARLTAGWSGAGRPRLAVHPLRNAAVRGDGRLRCPLRSERQRRPLPYWAGGDTLYRVPSFSLHPPASPRWRRPAPQPRCWLPNAIVASVAIVASPLRAVAE
jgi:hypothetical protein